MRRSILVSIAVGAVALRVFEKPDDGARDEKEEIERRGTNPADHAAQKEGIAGLSAAFYAIGCSRKWGPGQAVEDAMGDDAALSPEEALKKQREGVDKVAADYEAECVEIEQERIKSCPLNNCAGSTSAGKCREACEMKFKNAKFMCTTFANELRDLHLGSLKRAEKKAECVQDHCADDGAALLMKMAKENFSEACYEEAIKKAGENGDGKLEHSEVAGIVGSNPELKAKYLEMEDAEWLKQFDINESGAVEYGEIPSSLEQKILAEGNVDLCVAEKETKWLEENASGTCKGGDLGDCAREANKIAGETSMFRLCMDNYLEWYGNEQIHPLTGMPATIHVEPTA